MKYSLSILTLSLLLFCSLSACKKGNVAPSIETANDTIAAQVNGAPMIFYSIQFSAYTAGAYSEFNIIGGDNTRTISLHIANYHGVGTYLFTGSNSSASFQDSTTTYAATSGSVIITKTTNSYIQGIFSFTAGPYNITNGLFNSTL